MNIPMLGGSAGRPAFGGVQRPRPLHPAQLRGAHGLRLQASGPVRQALRGPHHLPRRAGRRRLGRRHHGPAARAREPGPGPRHHHVHQLARWLVHRDDGDLRHDAVHPAADPDGRARPGGLRRRGPRCRRHARQAPRAAERPHPDPPARRSARPGGQASDIEIQAAEILRMRTWLEETLAKHSNRAVEQVNKDIERDKILTAEEALEYGLDRPGAHEPQDAARARQVAEAARAGMIHRMIPRPGRRVQRTPPCVTDGGVRASDRERHLRLLSA